MRLREGEEVLKTYHHHPTPFGWIVIRTVGCFLPFYLILYFLNNSVEAKWLFISYIAVFTFLALVLIYQSLIFWLDKLVLTNQRIIFIDYKLLTMSEESEVFIWDIQDISTKEKGILSYFWIFDYGTLTVETSASDVSIIFVNAPNPEGIRQFIYHIRKQ